MISRNLHQNVLPVSSQNKTLQMGTQEWKVPTEVEVELLQFIQSSTETEATILAPNNRNFLLKKKTTILCMQIHIQGVFVTGTPLKVLSMEKN